MDKKTFSTLFTLIATLINVVCTLIIIIALCALCYVVIHFGFKVDSPEAYLVSWMICFFVGMIGNMFIFNKFLNAFVIKHHLEKKLEGWALSRASRHGSTSPYTYAQEEEEKKPKSRMPDSVIEQDDPWEKR